MTAASHVSHMVWNLEWTINKSLTGFIRLRHVTTSQEVTH